MIRLLFRSHTFFSIRFKPDHYSNEDYSTMCGLLREKYQLHNKQIQTSGLIKLLDDADRVIGVYTASEARKKSQASNLDMVLINAKSSPITCKAMDFRKKTLNKFYQQIVQNRQKQLQFKANTVKSIKVTSSLSKNEMIVKTKQIVELSQKHSKIRVFMSVKHSNKEQSLSKLQEIKNQLLGKCYVQEEISNRRFEEVDQESKNSSNQVDTYSFVVRARQSDLSKKTIEQKKHDPQTAIQHFLKNYYSQEDGDMMDLKSAGLFIVDTGIDSEIAVVTKSEKQVQKQKNPYRKQIKVDQQIIRQAEARILNKRLKVLLSLTV